MDYIEVRYLPLWTIDRAWHGAEISVWNKEDARMEWKTIFHTRFQRGV